MIKLSENQFQHQYNRDLGTNAKGYICSVQRAKRQNQEAYQPKSPHCPPAHVIANFSAWQSTVNGLPVMWHRGEETETANDVNDSMSQLQGLQRPTHGIMSALCQRSMYVQSRGGVSSRSFHDSISQQCRKCAICILASVRPRKQVCSPLEVFCRESEGNGQHEHILHDKGPISGPSLSHLHHQKLSGEHEMAYTDMYAKTTWLTEHDLQRREHGQIRTLPVLEGKTAYQIAGEYEAAQRLEIRHRREHACVGTAGAFEEKARARTSKCHSWRQSQVRDESQMSGWLQMLGHCCAC